ncbi:Cytochrome c oxidase assembly protein cox15 [Rhodotorula sphaerocarpa]
MARVAPADHADSTFPDPPEIPLTTPLVSKYLFAIAGLVFAIVVVGGMTRLTESGLSITEWNVVKGVKLPITQAEWQVEFEKYKATPEWKINNQHITLEDFKTIYMWEWAHRILGRIIGLTFLAPIPYFAYTRQLGRGAFAALFGIASLIGGQGALGWYMVKSGLDEQSVQDLGGVPRVSQYRLAAHLGMAFLVYSACLRFGLGVGRDWKLARKAKGLAGWKSVEETLRGLQSKTVGRTRALVTVVTGLVFTTALSGAFVAGLDAGLIYNEWPLMGGQLHPPASELNKDFYCRKEDKSDRWRNITENPTTVQFDHRMLAYTTFASIVSLFLYARRPHIRAQLPPTTYRLIKGTMHMSFLQVALGISTLLYLVPIHLAATHQAGSLVLLSLALATGASLRRPSSRVVSEAMRVAQLRQKAAQIKV